jgi:hypothetical protein
MQDGRGGKKRAIALAMTKNRIVSLMNLIHSQETADFGDPRNPFRKAAPMQTEIRTLTESAWHDANWIVHFCQQPETSSSLSKIRLLAPRAKAKAELWRNWYRCAKAFADVKG